MSVENITDKLHRRASEFVQSLGSYGPILAIVSATFSISFVHLSAFILAIPEGLRPVVDLGTGTAFSLVVLAHAVLSAILARVIVGSISFVRWSLKLGLHGTAVGASLYAFPRFLWSLITRKVQYEDFWDEHKLRPLLVDAALDLGKAGAFAGNVWFKSLLTAILTTSIFLWSYLGFNLAIQALSYVVFLTIILFFPVAALQFYVTAKQIAKISRLPEFGDMEELVDNQVLNAQVATFSLKNQLYLFLVILLSSSAISGALRLTHLQDSSDLLIDEGGSSRAGSLILANAQGFLFWDPALERHRFVPYASQVSVCETPKNISELGRGCLD